MGLSWKIWLLIIVLLSSLLSIAPWKALEKGVLIQSIDKNTTEFDAGLRAGMIIKQINSNPISTLQDYSNSIENLFLNSSEETKITITTDQGSFILVKNSLLIEI